MAQVVSTPTPAPSPAPSAARDLATATAADFEESPQAKIRRLERLLAEERQFSVKVTRQLHRTMRRELRELEQRLAAAEQGATRARERAASLRARNAALRERLSAATAGAPPAGPVGVRDQATTLARSLARRARDRLRSG